MKDVDTKQDKSNKYPQTTITFFICSTSWLVIYTHKSRGHNHRVNWYWS